MYSTSYNAPMIATVSALSTYLPLISKRTSYMILPNCSGRLYSLVSGDIPSPRWGHSGTLVSGNMILFLGGREGAKPVALNEYHTLDLKTMTWRRGGTVKPSPKSRYAHGALCISGLPNSPNLPLFQPSENNSNPNFPTFHPIQLRTDIDTSDIPPPPAPDMDSPPKTVLIFGGHGGRTRYYADTHLLQLPANIEVLQKYVAKYSYAIQNFQSESTVPVTHGIALQSDAVPGSGEDAIGSPSEISTAVGSSSSSTAAAGSPSDSGTGGGNGWDTHAPLKGDILLAAPVVTAGTGTGALATEDLSPGTLVPLGVQTPQCLPTVGVWTSPAVAGSPPSRRSGHTITLQGENVIVVGGYNGTEILSDIGILNLRTWYWSIPQIVGDRLPPLVGHSADLLPQTSWIFIFGGSISATELSAATFALDMSNPSVISTTLLHTTCKKQAPSPRFWHRTVLVMGSTRRESKKKKKAKGAASISLAKTLPLTSQEVHASGTGLGLPADLKPSPLKPEAAMSPMGLHPSGSTGNLSDPAAVAPSEQMSHTGAGYEDEQYGMETYSFSGVSTVYQALMEMQENEKDPLGIGAAPLRNTGYGQDSSALSVCSTQTGTTDAVSCISNPTYSSVGFASTKNAAVSSSETTDPVSAQFESTPSTPAPTPTPDSSAPSSSASATPPVYYHILLFGGSGEWGQSFNEVSALDISPIVHARTAFMAQHEANSKAKETGGNSTAPTNTGTNATATDSSSPGVSSLPPLLPNLSRSVSNLLPDILSEGSSTSGPSLAPLSTLTPLSPLTLDQMFQNVLKNKFGLRKDVQHVFFEERKPAGELIGLLGNTSSGASNPQHAAYAQANAAWAHPANVAPGKHPHYPPHMMHPNAAGAVGGMAPHMVGPPGPPYHGHPHHHHPHAMGGMMQHPPAPPASYRPGDAANPGKYSAHTHRYDPDPHPSIRGAAHHHPGAGAHPGMVPPPPPPPHAAPSPGGYAYLPNYYAGGAVGAGAGGRPINNPGTPAPPASGTTQQLKRNAASKTAAHHPPPNVAYPPPPAAMYPGVYPYDAVPISPDGVPLYAPEAQYYIPPPGTARPRTDVLGFHANGAYGPTSQWKAPSISNAHPHGKNQNNGAATYSSNASVPHGNGSGAKHGGNSAAHPTSQHPQGGGGHNSSYQYSGTTASHSHHAQPHTSHSHAKYPTHESAPAPSSAKPYMPSNSNTRGSSGGGEGSGSFAYALPSHAPPSSQHNNLSYPQYPPLTRNGNNTNNNNSNGQDRYPPASAYSSTSKPHSDSMGTHPSQNYRSQYPPSAGHQAPGSSGFAPPSRDSFPSSFAQPQWQQQSHASPFPGVTAHTPKPEHVSAGYGNWDWSNKGDAHGEKEPENEKFHFPFGPTSETPSSGNANGYHHPSSVYSSHSNHSAHSSTYSGHQSYPYFGGSAADAPLTDTGYAPERHRMDGWMDPPTTSGSSGASWFRRTPAGLLGHDLGDEPPGLGHREYSQRSSAHSPALTSVHSSSTHAMASVAKARDASEPHLYPPHTMGAELLSLDRNKPVSYDMNPFDAPPYDPYHVFPPGGDDGPAGSALEGQFRWTEDD